MTKEIKELQNRVIKICEELYLNSVTFAKMIEFDDIELVDSVLSKKAVPTLTMLNKIVTHLGINPAWLFDMPYPIAYSKFNTDNLKMFNAKPFAIKGEENLSKYCESINARNIMLVFENFNETNNNPKVAIIVERDFVYQVVSVFDFFDTNDERTKDGLCDINNIIDTTSFSPFNLMINTLSVANFKEMLSNQHHIGNFVAKNQLADKTADQVVRLVFEFNDEIAKKLEKNFDFKSEFLGEIDFIRSFVKSSSN